MKQVVFEAAVRRLQKQAGGKFADELRDEIRELLSDYVESKAKSLLEKVAVAVQNSDLGDVLKIVEERIERRGAGAEDFRREALRRATESDDDDDGQQPEDSEALDGGEPADHEA